MKLDQNMAFFFAFKMNSTTFNLRIGVFPQFVIFKFDRNVEVIKRAVKK